MADTYWLSFRLHDSDGYEATYSQRLKALNDEIEAACGNHNKWWFETTSFFIFASVETTDQIVTRIKRAIDTDVDLVVLGKTDYKTGRVVGRCKDQDIFTLVPFMKKA